VILIYRLILIAAMYLAMFWLILRFAFPRQYAHLASRYRSFELRLEQADVRPFFRWADALSKFALVTLASALVGLILAGVAAGVLSVYPVR
jgi:hypothetical protein